MAEVPDDVAELLGAQASTLEAAEATRARRAELDAADKANRSDAKRAQTATEEQQRQAPGMEREALDREERRADARARIIGIETASRMALEVAQTGYLRVLITEGTERISLTPTVLPGEPAPGTSGVRRPRARGGGRPPAELRRRGASRGDLRHVRAATAEVAARALGAHGLVPGQRRVSPAAGWRPPVTLHRDLERAIARGLGRHNPNAGDVRLR